MLSTAKLFLLPLTIVAWAGTALSAPPPPRQSQIWRTYERAERFGSAAMGRLVSRSDVEPHWIDGGARFWYRDDGPKSREFILVDAERGTRKPAFDHKRLALALAKAAGIKIDPTHLPFTSISFPTAATLAFRLGSQPWKCDLATYACAKAPSDASEGESAVEPPPPPPKSPTPGVSPDGKWVAITRDSNIFVRSAADGTEAQLSEDGVAGNAYGGVTWSPDSHRFTAVRTLAGENFPMYMVDSSPAGQVRPVLRQIAYALPGDRVDTYELDVFDVAPRKQTKVDAPPLNWGDAPEVHWKQDGRRFTFEHTDRGYQRERVEEVDAETGAVRTLIDERSDTFVFPPVRYIKYLDATNEILWTSERDGWNHLYLYDAATASVKRQITRGPWVVRGIEAVDEKTRQVVFTASGRNPHMDPYLLQYYRVNLDGTGLICLTPGNGQHTIRFSPDHRFYLDRYSRVDLAPVTELRRFSNGSLICTLETADVSRLLATGWRWPEPFRAKGRDGKTDIWGVIFRPSRLDTHRKYPIIESIYAGPQDSFAPKTFSAQHGLQVLAELGFIVVQIDGMGTANRSKSFHNVAYKNLGDSGFPDRIAWMKAAAAKYPYLDLSRVGVYGMSAGGYNAAHALIARPDFYKVAVAMSGNHDHRTDKVWWNELWMGYPVGPHYARQSNVVNAAKLKGRLLLVHGELDDNVNPYASTMQFVNALIKANKDFDLLMVPGAGHGFGTYVQRRMWDYFVRYLQGIEPPIGYELKAPADSSVNITVRNRLRKTVTLYWVSNGSLTRYKDIQPGHSVTQHTFIGHEWQAQADGLSVSTYTASAESPEWVIEENTR